MKSKLKNIGAFSAILLMVLVILPINADAATLKLNKTSTSMYVGGTTTLKVKGTSSKVKWTSSKKKVATVTSSGKVTAKQAGNTNITAKIGKKKLVCKVTVKNPYLNETELSLIKGGTTTLKLTGSKVKSWSSTDKKIATVSSKGKIIAKSNGTATIKAKAKNGKTYSCIVTVAEKHIHSYISEITKQATCLEDGIKTYTCSCGSSYTETINATGHTKSDWIIDTSATCATLGSKHKECTVCHEILETESVPMLEHTKSDWVIDNEATCTSKGHRHKECTVCNTLLEEEDINITHLWGDGVITTEPTCTLEGVKTYTCTLCNATKTEPISKIDHNYVKGSTIAPTCTEDGYTIYACSMCHNEEHKDVVEATGHNYVDEVVAPTCTEQGYTKHTCAVCSDTYNDTYVYANGHTYGEFVETLAPADFETFGTAKMVCPDCGEVLFDNLTAVLVDLGNGNSTTVYGYYDYDEAKACFDLTYQYKAENGILGKYGFEWYEDEYNFSCIRTAEMAVIANGAYKFDGPDYHTRPNGENIGCSENMTASISTDKELTLVLTSQEAFDRWIASEGHKDNIEAINNRKMSSSEFKVWLSEWDCWAIFWVQNFY